SLYFLVILAPRTGQTASAVRALDHLQEIPETTVVGHHSKDSGALCGQRRGEALLMKRGLL
ncbi:unnamed protein product, partial [Gulo gulo]